MATGENPRVKVEVTATKVRIHLLVSENRLGGTYSVTEMVLPKVTKEP